MADKFWSKVAVSLASAAGLSASQAVNAITAANPAVLTYSGADTFANGDYVYIPATGMVEVNKTIRRVANVNAAGNTLELEGLDATGFGTFISGTIQKITFDRTFTTLMEPAASGGDPVFEDTTTIHDAKDTQAIVSSTAESYSFNSKWEPADAALVECNKASRTRTPRAVMLVYPDNSRYLFFATVSAPLFPTASGRKVTTPLSFALENTGTAYGT